MAQSTRSAGAGAGRRSGLARSGAARPTPSRGTTPRAGTPRVRTIPGRRKPVQQSTGQKLFGALTGALSGTGGKAVKKAKPSGAKGPAGLALLGAGAFAALKNRDKLTSMVKGKSSSSTEGTYTPSTAPPTTPVTPVATTPVDTTTDSTLDNSPSGIRPIE
jgi:hypothetical protein